MGLPATAADAQCNQPATLRVPVQVDARRVRRLRPGNPPSDVADDDDRPGQDGPVHRPGRDRLPGPRPVQDRRPLRPGQAVDGVGPAGAVEPQAPDHPRRELRHRPPGRRRRPDVRRTTPRCSRGFAVMSTALNNAGHNCNIATQAESMVMAKERLVEQYGELRYTIGTGCSGGSLDPAAGRERLPGHLPGHPAAVQLPGLVVDGPAARRLPPAPPVRRGPGEVGAGRRLGPGLDRGGRGPSQPRQLDRLRHRLLDLARRARRRLPGRARRGRSTTRRPTPAACAARSPTT